MTKLPLSRVSAKLIGLASGVTIGLGVATASPATAEPDVVASIKPVNSLVAAVMEGVGTPYLIVRGGGSPHSFALKPSDAQAMSDAEVIFWVGPGLEAFLSGPLETIGDKAKVVELSKAHDLVRLPYREGGPWDEHAHDDEHDHKHGHDDDHKHGEAKHGHDDYHKHGEAKREHDDHDHKHGEAKHAHDDDHKHGEAKHDHDDHDHKHGEAKHDHDDHDHKHGEAKHAHDDDHKHGEAKHAHDHDHKHGATDMHLWLDPRNAKAMVEKVVEALVSTDPANQKFYEANAKALVARLDALEDEIRNELNPVADRPFIVFHDAYQYLENRFGLNAAGSITVSPEVQPGAKRLKEMRDKIAKLGAVCVFAEPQFEPKLVTVVVEGTRAKTAVLDPLGADLEDGPDLYFELMRRNAKALADCLSQSS